jgi:hypothetical protein
MTGIVKGSFIVALVSIALAGGNSFAKNVLEPGEETQLHIPKMKAPTFDGKITKEIADKLSISVRTVETHRSKIMKKLKVSNASEMIRLAYKKNLI